MSEGGVNLCLASQFFFSADLKIKNELGTKIMKSHRVPEKIVVYL
jgi:hypothetical protein